MKIIRSNSTKQLEKIYCRGFVKSRRVQDKVKQIIEDVNDFNVIPGNKKLYLFNHSLGRERPELLPMDTG